MVYIDFRHTIKHVSRGKRHALKARDFMPSFVQQAQRDGIPRIGIDDV